MGVLMIAVASILRRSLKNDFSKLEMRVTSAARKVTGKRDDNEEVGLTSNTHRSDPEDVQWKKLQGDVFRAPPYPAILAVLLGTGLQVGLISFVFIVCNMLGFLTPIMRPLYLYHALMLMALAGWGNGYITSRTLKFWGGTDWFFAATISSTVYPLFVATTIILIDLIEKFE